MVLCKHLAACGKDTLIQRGDDRRSHRAPIWTQVQHRRSRHRRRATSERARNCRRQQCNLTKRVTLWSTNRQQGARKAAYKGSHRRWEGDSNRATLLCILPQQRRRGLTRVPQPWHRNYTISLFSVPKRRRACRLSPWDRYKHSWYQLVAPSFQLDPRRYYVNWEAIWAPRGTIYYDRRRTSTAPLPRPIFLHIPKLRGSHHILL